MQRKHNLRGALLLMLLASACAAAEVAASPHRPNILLIVADDLGYTDIGAYGSEIRTPHLDALAAEGIRFSQFYASPMCSPSRAMLLTGRDSHRVGLGNLAERLSDNQRGKPGYEGRLNATAVTLSEQLSDAGYRNYMVGKWHLGADHGADPPSRGFRRSFALHDSGAGHFSNMLPLVGPGKVVYAEDGTQVMALPDDFYSTRFYTDKLLEYLEADRDSQQPFFAYLAYTAPHFPLQAPADSIARHRGDYDAGYDELQRRRLGAAQMLGLVPRDIAAFPGNGTEPAWIDLDEPGRARASRLMEIYAAMIDDLDRNIGRILAYLQETRHYDDTLIVFLSDNGAEGHLLSQGLEPLRKWAELCCDNSLGNMGNADSYLLPGPQWVRASMAPFRMFKGFTSEGGIRVPAIVHYPGGANPGTISDAVVSIMDVAPTILTAAGLEAAADLQGRSLMPLISGRATRVHPADHVFAWELLGKRALRQGEWKIVRDSRFVDWWDGRALGIRRDTWQLYNLAADPAELHDISDAHSERLQRMIRQWEDYAAENGIVLPDTARSY